MKAKNNEIIYKYELDKYNNSISNVNETYKKIHSKIQLADKSRIMFIKTSFDKYRSYMEEYINNIQDFLKVIENYISDDICSKDEKHNLQDFSKFNKEEKRVKEQTFVSFNQFVENEKNNKNDKQVLKYELMPNDLKIMKMEEKERNEFLKSLTNDLLSENEVSTEKMAKLIELFQYNNENSDVEKNSWTLC